MMRPRINGYGYILDAMICRLLSRRIARNGDGASALTHPPGGQTDGINDICLYEVPCYLRDKFVRPVLGPRIKLLRMHFKRII